MKIPKPFKSGDPESHIYTTRRLAKLLDKADVYKWLVELAYFPEPYVLPPCFKVSKSHGFGKPIFGKAKKNYTPPITEPIAIEFPKTKLTDRKFGVVDPRINADIAYWLSSNWLTIVGKLLNPKNKVCSYSFPVPLTVKTPGKIGNLRSGRSIYEFIEMAENDLAAVAYRYKHIIKTDVKNFYPSIYTHSLSWALHGKFKDTKKRRDYSYVGNRLDKLFQNANDGRTNGIPIGSGVADIAAELVLSQVDLQLSKAIDVKNVLVVRFKDDYRILCVNEHEGRKTLKALQASLKEFNLELNDSKTEIHTLPDGLFRPWKSFYHSINPNPKLYYSFSRLKETYLAVVEIDRKCPNTGVIDRFLVDIVRKKSKKPNFTVKHKTLPQIISLLLMLGTLHVKAFPKVLAVLEMILKTETDTRYRNIIANHLNCLLEELCVDAENNSYLILWIVYFLRTNNLAKPTIGKTKIVNSFVRSVFTSRNWVFKDRTDFTLFRPLGMASKSVSLLDHLDVFKPQEGA